MYKDYDGLTLIIGKLSNFVKKVSTQIKGGEKVRRLSGFKLARMKAGLTQLELARKLGCSESLIAKWETGRGKPNPEKLEQLCKLLGCRPEDLSGEGAR